VLALIRDGVGSVPEANEPLQSGDIVALSGSRDAIESAERLLLRHPDDVSDGAGV
jgi:Trk K+ transport system NAD-binding subunit